MRPATKAQLAAIRSRAMNAHTRIVQAEGVKLTHVQAERLGQEALAWLSSRLGLTVWTDSEGVYATPGSRS